MKKRVLLVDDDPMMLRLVAQHLRGAQYEVLTARDGREAMRVMLAERPPLVISDWSMPDMTGLDLCKAIRQTEGINFVYLIILTAQAEKERVVEALAAGANDFLGKPFDGKELLARVNAGMRIVTLESDLTCKTTELYKANAELRGAHAQTRQILESMPSPLISVDREGQVSEWNQAAERVLGISAIDAWGHRFDELDIAWDRAAVTRAISECRSTRQPVRVDEVRFRRPDGGDGVFGITVAHVQTCDDTDEAFLLVVSDITEHRMLQIQLAQAQRLESVGQLAAGIAHEINTPTQFVSDNARFLQNAFPKLQDLLARYRQLLDVCRAGPAPAELLDDVEAAVRKVKPDYLLEQIPGAITDSLEGLERIAKIVRAMKDFSHPGQQGLCAADLNKAIESTVTVARNEWKYVAEMKLDLDPALPHVLCMLGDFNQVILNIVVNAAHAIADAGGDSGQGKGTITVTTREADGQAEIRISDTGPGIPEEHRDKIFDHFFTTKPVGKGTGQGLAMARRVIVEKHHGTLTFETEVGRGTTFIIRLPVGPDAQATTEKPENELAYSAGR